MTGFRNWLAAAAVACGFLLASSSAAYGLTISNTSPATYVWDKLDVGKLEFIDRTFTFSSVPASYVGFDYLQTANNDKASTGDTFVTFDVDQNVKVYVAHDDRIGTKPAWMSTFTDNGDDLVAGGGTFSLFAQVFPAGTVTLGGNDGSSASMYTVVVEPWDSTPPLDPQNLGATVVGPNQVDLDWDDNIDADLDSYNVYRDTTSGFIPSAANRIASGVVVSIYSDLSVAGSTTYYYVVTAVDIAANESGPSNEVTATTPADTTPPADPTGLTATALSGTEIDLDWDDNGEPDLAGYDIYRDTSPGVTTSPARLVASLVSTSSYLDTGLLTETTYYYVVKAVDTTGNESLGTSNEASATTLGGLPPGWSNQDVGGVGKAGSAVYAAATDTFTIEGAGADIWGRADEFHYVYRTALLSGNAEIVVYVTSQENTNSWAKAGPMIRETLDANSKNAMMQLTPTNGCKLNWRATTGGDSSNTGPGGIAAPYWLKLVRRTTVFEGYRSDDPGTSGWTLVGSATVDMATDVYIGLAVTSHVDATLCTVTMSDVTITPGDNTPLAAPANLTATAVSSQMTLDWDDIVDPTLTGYNLYRSETPSVAVTAANLIASGLASSTYTDIGLTGSTTYYYVVTSLDDWYNESDPPSNEAFDTTPADVTAPDAPANFILCAASSDTVDLFWDDSTELDFDYYNVYRDTVPGFTPAVGNRIAAGLTSSELTDGALVTGTTYYYVVTAVDTSGNESVVSIERYATPGDGTLPPGWFMTDIGDAASYPSSGYYDADNEAFTIRGRATTLNNLDDHFNYVYRQISGNCDIVLRVVDMERPNGNDPNGWARVGIILRENLTDPSPLYTAAYTRPNNYVYAQYRQTADTNASGANKSPSSLGISGKPLWLRLVRTGDVFAIYGAPDVAGSPGTWTLIKDPAPTVNLPGTVYAGLFVCSSDTRADYECETFFFNVSGLDLPPHVSITAPLEGVTLFEQITIEADASDGFGVSFVEFFVTDPSGTETSIGADATAPYTTAWDASAAPPGPHVIKVIATDTAGYTATDSIQVYALGKDAVWHFDVPTNYQYDTTDIQIADSCAQLVGPVPGWWDASWTKRRNLTFDNSAQTEDLVDFPVLIKLDSSRIDYANTQDYGEDIRFVDAAGVTVLPHEIAEWNEAGTSYVWVKVPQITGGSDTDSIWMYYGNSGVADGQNAAGVWSNGYVAVWHLNEAAGSGAYLIDSTGNLYDGTPTNTTYTASGRLAGARTFSASGDWIGFNGSGALFDGWGAFTLEMWMYPDYASDAVWEADGGDRALNKSNVLSNGRWWRSGSNPVGTGVIQIDIKFATAGTSCRQVRLYRQQWNDVVWAYDGTDLKTYLNGAQYSTESKPGGLASDTTPFTLGNTGDPIKGMLDEVRVSNIVRSADWFAAQYKSMRDDAFVSFGGEATNAPSFRTNWPSVRPAAGKGADYTELVGFGTTLGPGSLGEIRFHVSSDDGTSWYYWSGSSWDPASDYITANTADVINANISSFSSPGTFTFRAFLGTDGGGTLPCSLDAVTLYYNSDLPPRVVATSPAGTDVLKTVNVEVTFNEAMDPTTTEAAFEVKDGFGDPVAGTFSWAGNKLVFDPTADLSTEEAKATHTVTVRGSAQDLAANGLDGDYDGTAEGTPDDDYSWSFTVGGPPKVSSYGPTGIDVPVGSVVRIVFSEPMDQASVVGAFSISPVVAGVKSWDDAVTFVFDPDSDLDRDVEYTVTVADTATDLAGHALDGDKDGVPGGNFSWSFTVGNPPHVDGNTPTDVMYPGGVPQSGVPITVSFDEDMDAGSVEDAFSISPAVPGNITWTGLTDLTFTPDGQLGPSTAYTVTIAATATDTSGNQLAGDGVNEGTPFSWGFTTEADATPPTVVSTVPATDATDVRIGTTVEVTFSEPMKTVITAGAFVLTDVTIPASPVDVSGTKTWDGLTLIFTPDSPLDTMSTYSGVVQTTAEDKQGNTLTAEHTWDFYTEETPSQLVTIKTVPAGLSITVDGLTRTPPVEGDDFKWAQGSVHVLAVTDQHQAGFSPGTRYAFVQWDDGEFRTTKSVTVGTTDVTYIAYFRMEYELLVESQPVEGGIVDPLNSWCKAGSTLDVLARAEAGYTFAAWGGDLSGTVSPASLYMDGPKSVVAYFTQGSLDWALEFDGNDCVVDTGAGFADPGDTFTAEAWFKGGAHDGYILRARARVAYPGWSNPRYTLFYIKYDDNGANDTVTVGVHLYDLEGGSSTNESLNPLITSAAGDIVDGEWNHVALVKTPTKLFLYVNGVEVTGGVGVDAVGRVGHKRNEEHGPIYERRVTLGHNYTSDDPNQESFNGVIDEVRISSVARSFSPGAQGRLTPDADTLALWHIDEGLGLKTFEASGYLSYTGVLSGDLEGHPKWVPGCPFTKAATRAITVESAPAGRNILVDGVEINTSQIFYWAEGTRHTLEVLETLQAGLVGERFPFTRWDKDAALESTERLITVTVGGADATYTAAFDTEYRLAVQIDPVGSGSVDVGGVTAEGDTWHSPGAVLTLDAVYGAGYNFGSWSGALGGTTATGQSLTMDGPKSVTATFGGDGTVLYSVKVDTSPAGLGVTMLVDGVEYPAGTEFMWADGSSHTIAAPGVESVSDEVRATFVKWENDDSSAARNVTVAGPASFAAEYLVEYRLLVRVDPPGAGTISPNEDSWQLAGADVTLKAYPITGCIFENWSCPEDLPDIDGKLNEEITFDMDAAKVVTAVFKYRPQPVEVTPSAGPPDVETLVTIYGYNFQDGATVEFDGTPAPWTLYVDENTILCNTPELPTGAVDVKVTNFDGVWGELKDGYQYLLPLKISAVDPPEVPQGWSGKITVTGEGFDTTMRVFVAPAGGEGKGDRTMQTPPVTVEVHNKDMPPTQAWVIGHLDGRPYKVMCWLGDAAWTYIEDDLGVDSATLQWYFDYRNDGKPAWPENMSSSSMWSCEPYEGVMDVFFTVTDYGGSQVESNHLTVIVDEDRSTDALNPGGGDFGRGNGKFAPYMDVSTYVPYIVDGFETGDFSMSGRDSAPDSLTKWTTGHTGGAGDWSVLTDSPYEGTYCAKSGAAGAGETSWLQVSLELQSPGEVRFYAKTAGGAGDTLRFLVGGAEQWSASGDTAWQLVTYTVPSLGTRTLRWEYQDNGGAGAAWLDLVCLPFERKYSSTADRYSGRIGLEIQAREKNAAYDGFEKGDFSNLFVSADVSDLVNGHHIQSWDVTTGWSITSAETHYGYLYSATASGTGTATLEVTLNNLPAGVVKFWSKRDFTDGGQLRLLIDDNEEVLLTDTRDWPAGTRQAAAMATYTAGNHKFTWEYSGATGAGSQVWLDDIGWWIDKDDFSNKVAGYRIDRLEYWAECRDDHTWTKLGDATYMGNDRWWLIADTSVLQEDGFYRIWPIGWDYTDQCAGTGSSASAGSQSIIYSAVADIPVVYMRRPANCSVLKGIVEVAGRVVSYAGGSKTEFWFQRMSWDGSWWQPEGAAQRMSASSHFNAWPKEDWDTTNVPDGVYEVYGIYTRSGTGVETEYEHRIVTVNNGPPDPDLFIPVLSSPEEGDMVSGMTSVSITPGTTFDLSEARFYVQMGAQPDPDGLFGDPDPLIGVTDGSGGWYILWDTTSWQEDGTENNTDRIIYAVLTSWAWIELTPANAFPPDEIRVGIQSAYLTPDRYSVLIKNDAGAQDILYNNTYLGPNAALEVVGIPEIESIDPNSGPVSGNTEVTITAADGAQFDVTAEGYVAANKLSPHSIVLGEIVGRTGTGSAIDGNIAGTPDDTAMTETFTIRAMDSQGKWNEKDFTINIVPMCIRTESLPHARYVPLRVANRAMNYGVINMGSVRGDPEYQCDLAHYGGAGRGELEGWITWRQYDDPWGDNFRIEDWVARDVIVGTPLTSGTYTIRVTAKDNYTTVTKYYELVIFDTGSVYVLSRDLVDAEVYAYYLAFPLSAYGPVDAKDKIYTWALAPASGPLPGGLTLRTDGIIEGEPTQTGVFPFTVRATETVSGQWGDGNLCLRVFPRRNPPEFLRRVKVTAEGGRPPYTWSVTSGSLPTGMTLATNLGDQYTAIDIIGAAGEYGVFNFTIGATAGSDDVHVIPLNQGAPDQVAIDLGADLVLDVDGTLGGDDEIVGQTVTTGPDGICDSTAGTVDDVQQIPVGQGAPNTLAIGPGDNGLVDTPAALGDDVKQADGIYTGPNGVCETIQYLTAERAYKLVVYSDSAVAFVTEDLPDAGAGKWYYNTIEAGGGSPPYKFTLDTGSLPAGDLTLDPDGTISGVVDSAATDETFKVKVTDRDLIAYVVDTGTDGLCNTTAAGDDIQLVPVGQGAPDMLAIEPGPDGVLDSTAAIDDITIGNYIYTGPNGVCDTLKANDDVQVIAQTKGAPNMPAIDPGADGINDTTKASGDDTEYGSVQTTCNEAMRVFTISVASGAAGADPKIVTKSPLPDAVRGEPYGLEYEGLIEAVGGEGPYTWTIPGGGGKVPDGLHLNADLADVLVTVTVGSTTLQTELEGGFCYVRGPQVTSVTDTLAPFTESDWNECDSATITGAGFVDGARVFFGGYEAAVGSVTSGEIVCTIPTYTPKMALPETVDIRVVNPDGGVGELVLAYTFTGPPPPQVFAVDPEDGSVAGGTSVTIIGDNFESGVGLKVYFDDVPGPANEGLNVTFIDAQTLTAETQAHAAGKVDVWVENPDGMKGRGVDLFEFKVAGATVIDVVPDRGPWFGEYEVIITGSGFKAGVEVYFGDYLSPDAVRVTGEETTKIKAEVPRGPEWEDVTVSVVNPDALPGTWEPFTYTGPPVVQDITPPAGPEAGDQVVTITGTHFWDAIAVKWTNLLKVQFDGVPANEVTSVTETEILAKTPAGTPGYATVTVTNADGQRDSLGSAYEYIASPIRIGSVSPPVGLPGKVVTITGRGFQVNCKVYFGANQSPSATRIDKYELRAEAPAGAGTVDITVKNPDLQIGTMPNAFTYGLYIQSVKDAAGHSYGPTTQDTPVTIRGDGFEAGAKVWFGAQEVPGANITVSGDGLKIYTIAPKTADPADTGFVNVLVLNLSGDVGMLVNGWEYR